MNKTGLYRIDPSFVEHSCCWITAIVRDVPAGTGNYKGDTDLICECKESHAEVIVDALNGGDRLRGELAGSLAKNTELQERCYSYADKVAAMRDELLALEKRLVWEESRARTGTHGDGCERWGPGHYSCLLRKYDDVTGRPKPHFQD